MLPTLLNLNAKELKTALSNLHHETVQASVLLCSVLPYLDGSHTRRLLAKVCFPHESTHLALNKVEQALKEAYTLALLIDFNH